MSPEDVTAHFTRADGAYVFARWGRPIAPVVFGIDDASLATFKGALEAVTTLANHEMAETDPELGANLMVFFVARWQEMLDTPNLDRLVEGLDDLVERLRAADANQYRFFRFDEAGAIKAAFVFLKIDGDLAEMPADTLALSQAVQTILLWSDSAFTERSPLARAGEDGPVILRPDLGDLIRAAYDPVMPVAASDPSHALRLAARLGRAQ